MQNEFSVMQQKVAEFMMHEVTQITSQELQTFKVYVCKTSWLASTDL